MKGNYGIDYELYKGKVWISKQDSSRETQGTNVAILRDNGTLNVIGYVIRQGVQWTHTHNKYVTIEEIIWSVLKTQGWYDSYCEELLGIQSE